MHAANHHQVKCFKVDAALQQKLPTVYENACLQVNWGSKLLFVASSFFFAIASQGLGDADSTKKVMSHWSTSLPVHACFLTIGTSASHHELWAAGLDLSWILLDTRCS